MLPVALAVGEPDSVGAAVTAGRRRGRLRRHRQSLHARRRRVIEALHRYEKCVAASNARDDCAAEMEALDSAHDGFADAVADAKTCR